MKIEDIMIRNGMLENKMSCLPTRVTERSSTLIDLFFFTSRFSTKISKIQCLIILVFNFFFKFCEKGRFN